MIRKPPIKHAHPLVKFLDDELVISRRTKHWLCKHSGVPRTTIDRWYSGSRPRLDLLEAAINSLGFTITVRKLTNARK